jgi:hypothetical protein
MYTIDIFRDVRPSPSSMVVPTDLQRIGDFSQTYVSGLSGPTVTIYDPLTTVQSGSTYTRTPFAGNRVPQNMINPIAAKIMAVQLQPNLGVVARGQPNLLVTPNPDLEPYNLRDGNLETAPRRIRWRLRSLRGRSTLCSTIWSSKAVPSSSWLMDSAPN